MKCVVTASFFQMQPIQKKHLPYPNLCHNAIAGHVNDYDYDWQNSNNYWMQSQDIKYEDPCRFRQSQINRLIK